MIVMWEYEENSCQFIPSSTFIGCEEKQFSGLLFEEAVAWWLKRESFSYSTLYFSNLNFPNIFPRKFTCPTGEWWTKSTNPTTNYISYSPGLSDMAFFASLFQDNFCEIIPVWFNKGCQQNNWNICRWCFIAETNHQCFRAESCCTLSYLWFV